MSLGARVKTYWPFLGLPMATWLFWRAIARWQSSGDANSLRTDGDLFWGVAFLVCTSIYLVSFINMRRSIRTAIRWVEHLFQGERVLRPAVDGDFAALNRPLYGYGKVTLESQGYRMLADYVDQTLAEVEKHVSVLRVMVDSNGETVAMFSQHVNPLAPKMLRGKEILIVRFETEFADGTIIASENTSQGAFLAGPPTIATARYDLFMPIDRLALLHAERVRNHLAQHPPRTTPLESMDDVMGLYRRSERLRNEYRRSIGWLSADEVRAIHIAEGGNEYTGDVVKEVTVRVRRKMGLVTDGTGV